MHPVLFPGGGYRMSALFPKLSSLNLLLGLANCKVAIVQGKLLLEIT
jgi:hypothetical protein